MLESQIGGVAGMGNVLLAPLHRSAARGRGCIAASLTSPVLPSTKPHLVVTGGCSLPWLTLRFGCFTLPLLARLHAGFSPFLSLLTLALLTLALLTLTLLTLTLLTLTLLTLTLLALT